MQSDEMLATPFWRRSHYLDRMTLRDLAGAYFRHYAIVTYLLLAGAMVGLYVYRPASPIQTAAAITLVVQAYPLVWYSLHRWVLHSNWMFKVPFLAPAWKRIHYDHHQDPNHLEVLFGALYTTLPTLLLVTAFPGWLIGGAAAGFAAGLIMTCFYEFAHCIQHLGYKPRHPMLARMKARHMEHHFHDETGNFGITNFAWDQLFGTYYTRTERQAKSATMFNLGYTDEVARRFPWVAPKSGGFTSGHPPRRGVAND